MKNVLKIILLVSLIGSITIFSTGCVGESGNVEKEAVEVSSNTVESSSSSIQSEDGDTDDDINNGTNDNIDDNKDDNANGADSNKMYSSIKEYISSDDVKKMVDSMNSNIEEFEMNIKAEDNALIYEYIYTEAIPEESIALVEETLKGAAENQESIFNNILDSIKLYVDVDAPVVLLRYYNADGTLIAEIEFDGE